MVSVTPLHKIMKLSKAKSDRTLREDGVWMYRASVGPKDVDTSEEFFDDIATDLVDPEKYFSSPMTSGIGVRFFLILGDPLKAHHIGEFVIDGLMKSSTISGAPEYHLLWTRIGKWRSVDIEERSAKRLAGVAEALEVEADKKVA